MRAPESAAGSTEGSLGHNLLLLWLAGLGIRAAILAVPPLVPQIRGEFAMSETEVGLLIGLPLVLFALAAIPGSLLIARFGAAPTLAAGLAVTAFAGAARGLAPDLLTLYATTIAVGFGVAIMQPALPTLVREWMPRRVALGTAVSTNGMLVGVAAAPALMLPVVLPALSAAGFVGNWRTGFLVFALPVAVALVAVLLLAPRPFRGTAEPAAVPGQWWPDWRNPLIWMLGLTFGSNNALYYGANAFLADYLDHTGRAATIAPAIGWLNGAQLLASFVLLGAAERLQRRAWPYLVFGPLALVGVLGIAFGPSPTVVIAAAGLVGFALSITFVLTLALPPVLSGPGEVHRLAGGMFTISYTCAVIVPVICGALWDITGRPEAAFIPLGVCALTLTALGFTLTLRHLRHHKD